MLQLQDGSVNLGTAAVPFTLGQSVATFSENFDGVTVPALPSGWSTSFGGATAAAWRTTNSLADTAPNAAFTANAANVSSNELASPSIALPLGPNQLSFRHRF